MEAGGAFDTGIFFDVGEAGGDKNATVSMPAVFNLEFKLAIRMSTGLFAVTGADAIVLASAQLLARLNALSLQPSDNLSE